MTDMIFRNRKYTLAMFFACVGTVALFFGKLTGGEWVMLAGAIMGLYGAANVWQRQVEK